MHLLVNALEIYVKSFVGSALFWWFISFAPATLLKKSVSVSATSFWSLIILSLNNAAAVIVVLSQITVHQNLLWPACFYFQSFLKCFKHLEMFFLFLRECAPSASFHTPLYDDQIDYADGLFDSGFICTACGTIPTPHDRCYDCSFCMTGTYSNRAREASCLKCPAGNCAVPSDILIAFYVEKLRQKSRKALPMMTSD